MTSDTANQLQPEVVNGRMLRAWVNLSLRTKLLLFALALVTLPGIVFAMLAFAGTRSALEREVGIQLQQAAERGADALSAALERAQSDARSWVNQDVMRDLTVGDLDKRVSRFLRTVAASNQRYLEVMCLDLKGKVVATSRGNSLGDEILEWQPPMARAVGRQELRGPLHSTRLGRDVLEIGVPIETPDPPGGRIGTLHLSYDWSTMQSILNDLRLKLTHLGKGVAAIVVDHQGKVIGGAAFDGVPAQQSELAGTTWDGLRQGDHGTRRVRVSPESTVEVLVGAARLAGTTDGWSVLFIEPASEALAAVRQMRSRWAFMMAWILVIGLAVATLLARQVMQPLNEVTRATSSLALHPDINLPLVPVRSRNEVGQLAESFNRMTIALKKSQNETLAAARLAIAGELAAMVAHEVRTPLSVMRSSAQMLADHTTSQRVDRTELAETIVAEVDRVDRVVSGLIQLARPLPQRLEATLLADLLARAAALVAAQARKQNVHMSCNPSAAEATAFCDADQVYQVILNLLLNALQALTKGGSIELRVLVENRGTVGFSVKDDGPGLPSEIRDRIFQPFVSAREGGTGLGLAFVDRIVTAHHGTVAVHSVPGEGTVFEVRLPVASEVV